MDGAVLHTAQIWENDRLAYYSFRDAFLISVNLAGKELIDCDFTGAVFKAVLTVGWRPDRLTRSNTKFIYTDYSSEEMLTDAGPRRFYKPILESRVPAAGNFGEGKHENFTFSDYLRKPVRLNIALNVPPSLRTAVTNYLQLFTDFLKLTRGLPIELRTRLEGSKLRVEFLAQTEADIAVIRESFAEYQKKTGHSFDELKLNIAFATNVSQHERDLFLMKMERDMNSLKAMLQSEITYNRALLSKSEEDRQQMAVLLEASRALGALLEPIPVLGPACSVYVSYAWGEDQTIEGRRREDIVNRLCETMRTHGIVVGRDKERLKAGDSIDRFAHDISKASRVITVISEKYLSSEYCMVAELFRTYQRCVFQREEFQQKVVALVLDDAKQSIKDELTVVALAKQWKNIHDMRRHELEKIDPNRKSPDSWSRTELIGEMCERLPDMIGSLRDIVMKRGFDEIVADDFREVLARLRET
jgi:uncharacterized protein YjbI with pentapeptide repeats